MAFPAAADDDDVRHFKVYIFPGGFFLKFLSCFAHARFAGTLAYEFFLKSYYYNSQAHA